MKGACIALVVGLTLFIICCLQMGVSRSKGTIDVHLHDTYFVLSYASVAVFLFFFLGTFFSVGGVIGTHFKGKLFWASAIILLSIDTYYLIKFYKAFKNVEVTSFPMQLSSSDVV